MFNVMDLTKFFAALLIILFRLLSKHTPTHGAIDGAPELDTSYKKIHPYCKRLL